MPQLTPVGDRMVIGGHLVLAVLIALDDRDGLRLDHQIASEAIDLLGGSLRSLFVVIANGNQICHVTLLCVGFA